MIKPFDYLYFIVIGLLTLAGQIVIKQALNKHGAIPELSMDKVSYLFKVLLDPWVIFGFFLAFLAAVFWLAVMSKFDLSFAYPYMVACLMLITLAGSAIFLKETISVQQIAGVALIGLGIVVMSQ